MARQKAGEAPRVLSFRWIADRFNAAADKVTDKVWDTSVSVTAADGTTESKQVKAEGKQIGNMSLGELTGFLGGSENVVSAALEYVNGVLQREYVRIAKVAAGGLDTLIDAQLRKLEKARIAAGKSVTDTWRAKTRAKIALLMSEDE